MDLATGAAVGLLAVATERIGAFYGWPRWLRAVLAIGLAIALTMSVGAALRAAHDPV